MSHWDTTADCTEACAARPNCLVCGKVKAPVGRSLPSACAADYCQYECKGYSEEPRAGHLFRSEWREIVDERASKEAMK